MPEALIWWSVVELIGLTAFPLAFAFLRFLPDRGYSFAKTLGILLLTYLLWAGASARVIPNSRWAIVLLLALIAVAALAVASRDRAALLRFLKERWRHLLMMEAAFSITFFFALFLRSYMADIGSVEQPYELAYINAIIRSEHFPARDPWLSGHSIPLYHFGHMIVAMLTKLTDIPSRITFNLSLALIAALAFSGAFGLVYNLLADRCSARMLMLSGLLGGFLLMVMGNIEGFFELLAAHGIGSRSFYSMLDISGLGGPRTTSEWYPTEWNWYGRSIQIAGGPAEREFPFFSYLEGFVHGHSLALPFVLLGAVVALDIWRGPGGLGSRLSLPTALYGTAIALTLGAIGFINTWNLPPALLLFAIAVLGRNYSRRGALSAELLAETAAFVGPVMALSLVLYLPFYANLHAGGDLERLDVAGRSLPLDLFVTRPHHAVYVWLPFLWLIASFAIAALWGMRPKARSLALAVLPALAPLFAWAFLLALARGLGGLFDEVSARGDGWITFLALVALLTAVSLAFGRQLELSADSALAAASSFALATAGVGLLLILGMEFFWLHDLWGTRSTTLLKLGYHAWILLSVSAAFGAFHVFTAWRPTRLSGHVGRSAWLAATALILLAASIFPLAASFSRTNGFQNRRHLDGLILVKTFEPAEYEATEWLWQEVDGTPVILEAVGDSFSGYARVSSRTGLPTVLGWPYHEQLWRGSLEPQAGRREAVERVYTTTDPNEARAILERYDVEYVYVGSLERGQFQPASLSKFGLFMDIAFQQGEVTIYRRREPAS